jgi:hypothetical protein
MTRNAEIWHDFARELAGMPQMLERLKLEHAPDGQGLCVACTTPGRGTPQKRWPCSVRALVDHAVGLKDRSAGGSTWRGGNGRSGHSPVSSP